MLFAKKASLLTSLCSRRSSSQQRSSSAPQRTSSATATQESSLHNSDPRLVHIALDGKEGFPSRFDADSGRMTSKKNNHVTDKCSSTRKRNSSASQESSFHDSDPTLVHIALDEKIGLPLKSDGDLGRITSTKNNQVTEQTPIYASR